MFEEECGLEKVDSRQVIDSRALDETRKLGEEDGLKMY
jgi:hypothetical protein